MLSEAIEYVREFQRSAGQPVPNQPLMMTRERVNARIKWIVDELKELEQAKDIYEQADALTDSLYYLLGGFVEIGVEPDRLFEIVHWANMRKILPNGQTIQAPDLRIEKPGNWTHPDSEIRAEIDRQSV